MSKEYQNIDELFKSELGTQVKAPAHVKNNIDKALFGGSSKWLYWLIPVTILLIIIPILYNSLLTESIELGSKENSTLVSTKNLTHQFEKENNLNSNNSINSVITAQNNTENYTTNSSKDLNESSDPSQEKQLISNENKKTKTLSNKTDVKIDKTVKNQPKTEINSDSKKINKDEKKEIEKEKNEKENLIASNPELVNSEPKTILKEKDSSKNNVQPIIEMIVEQENKLVDQHISDSIEVDTLVEQLIVEEDTDTASIKNTEPATDIEVPKEKRKAWMISITGGADFKNSQLSAQTPELQSIYQSDISDKVGYSYDLEANYTLNNGIQFGTGLNYTKLSENYSFFKSESQVTDSSYTWVFTQDSMQDCTGTWYYWQDSTQQSAPVYSDVEIYNQNGKNSLTYLRIPIQLGYQFSFRKFKIDLFAAGRYNLLLKSQISYLNAANTQVIQNNGAFKNSYFDLVLGTRVHYNLFKNLYISAVFNYKPPTRINYYPDGVANRFQNFHLGLGLSLSL